jgi:CrcB protein
VSPLLWLTVGTLGGIGALLRFAVDTSVSRVSTTDFPAGTTVINLSGAFLLGVLSVSRLGAIPTLLLGAVTLGSYTTFSTWMLESHHLGEDGRTVLMAANLSLCLVLGLLACAVGRFAGGALW